MRSGDAGRVAKNRFGALVPKDSLSLVSPAFMRTEITGQGSRVNFSRMEPNLR